jgi:hypothetical protein
MSSQKKAKNGQRCCLNLGHQNIFGGIAIQAECGALKFQ